jgi:excisionase family DNA binding protein
MLTQAIDVLRARPDLLDRRSSGSSFLGRLPPERSSRRILNPSSTLNSPAKYTEQDEPFVRSATLKIHLTLSSNGRIYNNLPVVGTSIPLIGSSQIRPIPSLPHELGFGQMRTNNDRTRGPNADPTTSERRTNHVTVAEAAQLLGLSAEAVRMRIKRGTLPSEKVNGTVYVHLQSDRLQINGNLTECQPPGPTAGLTTNHTDLAESLRDEVEFLRAELKRREEVHVEENRRKDTIIARLTQRIPELPSASFPDALEPSNAPAESHQKANLSEATGAPQMAKSRPWWRRTFEG